jgi:hypothetical protein
MDNQTNNKVIKETLVNNYFRILVAKKLFIVLFSYYVRQQISCQNLEVCFPSIIVKNVHIILYLIRSD